VHKIKKPIVGGILSIVSGVLFTGAGLSILRANWGEIPPLGLAIALVFLFIGGIMPIVGGIFALKRKQWKLALAGSIGAITGIVFFAVPALILILMSKKEFE
jgi:glucose uptake protein GlcU